MTSAATRGAAAISAAARTPCGVSIMHQIASPGAALSRAAVSRTRSALSTLGNSTASSGKDAAVTRSASPQALSSGLTRSTNSRRP